jgi:hypothetical protein
MLKSVFFHLVVCFALLLAFTAVAQEQKAEASTTVQKMATAKAEDHYLALAAFYQNALDHVKALYHHAATNPKFDEAIVHEHADEICRSLNAAKKHQTVVEQELSARDKADFQDHLDVISKYRAKAKEHYQDLDNELFKSKTDPQEVKNIAASLYRDLMKAFDEYKEMRKHAGVPEPVEPPLTLEPNKPEKS